MSGLKSPSATNGTQSTGVTKVPFAQLPRVGGCGKEQMIYGYYCIVHPVASFVTVVAAENHDKAQADMKRWWGYECLPMRLTAEQFTANIKYGYRLILPPDE